MKYRYLYFLSLLALFACNNNEPDPFLPPVIFEEPLDFNCPEEIDELTLEGDWKISPLSFTGPDDEVLDAVFPTPDLGYFAYSDGKIWKLDLAAGTFSALPFDACEVQRISAPDANNIFVFPSLIEGVVSICGASNSTNFWYSSDGGLSWEERSIPNTTWIHHGHFINAEKGFVTASNASTSTINNLYQTLDGGQTWSKHDSVIVNIFLEADPFFFLSDSVGYLVGFQDLLYKTINGGTNWEAIYSTQIDLEKIYFIDEANGFASKGSKIPFANASGLYRSQNGGRTWTRIISGSVRGWHFVDYENGLAVKPFEFDYCIPDPQGSEVLFYEHPSSTSDAGLSWAQSEERLFLGENISLHFATAELGFYFSGEKIYQVDYQP